MELLDDCITSFHRILQTTSDQLEYLNITWFSSITTLPNSIYTDLVQSLSHLKTNQLKHFTLCTGRDSINFPEEIAYNHLESLTEFHLLSNRFNCYINEKSLNFYNLSSQLVNTTVNFDSLDLLFNFLNLSNMKPNLLNLTLAITYNYDITGPFPVFKYLQSLKIIPNHHAIVNWVLATQQHSLKVLDISCSLFTTGNYKIKNFSSFIIENTSIEILKLKFTYSQDIIKACKLISKNKTIFELEIIQNLFINPTEIDLSTSAIKYLHIDQLSNLKLKVVPLPPFTLSFKKGQKELYTRALEMEKPKKSWINKILGK
ncbi:hypothetical protein DLAC_07728 [Tieghemostelium lacteum]|uniref:Uncharacterized protein n=1 Tax=Tieghemostelium lacteum TaxID=361077 RepID=A0A151ZAA4_TIELA|nr:hypothetical protein DLAC_07728 [Tieghemostelium lacteum]|eukprot:KYQ90858.1 hypothetical protein DLAC_07728 [Tieghemostelium lacteum]